MSDEKIKDSFVKVKQDIDSLKEEINYLKESLQVISHGLSLINEKIDDISEKQIPTQNEKIQTDQDFIPTDNLSFKALKPQNQAFSIGNSGVPTDRQTNQQTDQQTNFKGKNVENTFENALEILSSLDVAKKELRLRFKRLTDQEFLVFTTIYQLEEEGLETITYRDVALKLNLTESSIRDYIGKLAKKDIPVEKTKLNNKAISLKISDNLKKVASLATIFQLRDI